MCELFWREASQREKLAPIFLEFVVGEHS
jgi:hypothetical protein